MCPKEEQYTEDDDDVWAVTTNSTQFFQQEKLQVGDTPCHTYHRW